MSFAASLGDKEWKRQLWLLIASFLIYTLHFGDLYFQFNKILSSITGDALKNYYTYAFHITHDRDLLNFTGMHYPFGEHPVYTDCQPLLTWILHFLPFLHPYLIGILHALIFGSFIISPLLIYRSCKMLGLKWTASFFASLGIALLAPQFAKIVGGHHGLAYGFVIPLNILLLLRIQLNNDGRATYWLLLFNSLIFFVHPYLGFGTSAFSLLTLLAFLPFVDGASGKWKTSWRILLTGLVPIVVFKTVMKLTDHHVGRPTEPYGSEALVENPSTLLAPDFGPLQHFMESMLPPKVIHFEGHSYLGLGVIIMALISLLLLIFKFRSTTVSRPALSLLIAGSVLLFISFGYHIPVIKWLGLPEDSVRQFRAVCRFAWFFYYALPLFLLPLIVQWLEQTRIKYAVTVCMALFFALQLWEAHFYMMRDRQVFWNQRNIFNRDLLTGSEKKLIEEVTEKDPQCIMPLPVFYLGSEMFNRWGSDNSMIPSMLLAFHTGKPIFGCWMSRTSISETSEALQVLNSYVPDQPIDHKLTNQPILLISTKDAMLPDEQQLLPYTRFFWKNDSLNIGLLTKKDLRTIKKDAQRLSVDSASNESHHCIYIATDNRQPFQNSNTSDLHVIMKLPSDTLPAGDYILSLHYHYGEQNYKALACDMIISDNNEWKPNNGMNHFSGFYKGYGVVEFPFKVVQGHEYIFLLKGLYDKTYHISDFMIRPKHLTLFKPLANGDTIWNNYSPRIAED